MTKFNIELVLDDTTSGKKNMRYFIYYPPSKSIRLIDVNDSVLVEDILTLVKQEFGLNVENSGPAETSVVLSYNGSDLKPKWSLTDLSIPSGAIIRCLYREQKAADLYIHCGFNKQTLKLFDSSITFETTIGTIRKKISDILGLPLSTFCLETSDSKQRLFDQMKLMNYDLKIHDHIHLKVWKGYEKFINSCVKGFTEQYAHDDLTRHYQTQVALYIAAFYGHMELATYVMQQGARSDRPVGEHPSRQWSSETTTETLPETLKCPIHIAVERGHVKIVDLFVRHSILCTQIRDPITNYLPFKLALSYSISATSKEEKQRYRVIYFYLHDKQYNLKVPLNSTGEYVSNLLTSTISANAVHRSSSNLIYVSLPAYCKIISWYERAREIAWKKFGGRFYSVSQTKRVYPKKGLLGYKVLIDGFNNTFEIPTEQLQNMPSAGITELDQDDRYAGFSEDEREKIIKMKSFVKDFALDDRKRAKQIAAANLQQSRRPPLLLTQTSLEATKHLVQPSEGITTSTEFSNSQNRSNVIVPDLKTFKAMLEIDNSSVTNLSSSTLISAPPGTKRMQGKYKSNEKNKRLTKTANITLTSAQSSRLSVVNGEEKRVLPGISSPVSNAPTTFSAITHKLETVANANKNNVQPLMSSADAYAFSSSRIALEAEKHRAIKRQELFSEIAQSTEQHESEESTNPLSTSFPLDRKSFRDVDTYIPLPDRPVNRHSGPIKSRLDIDIRQATVRPYERYASATTRATAVNCLQEAGYFKGKSWLKQVEISKEMVKHHVKRRIRRADDEQNNKPTLLPLRTNIVTTSAAPHRTNTVKVN